MNYINKTFAILILFWFFLPDSSFSQSWDYEKYPHLPFTINHLDAELSIDETGSVEGDLLYSITFRDDDVDSLIFHAGGIEILNTVADDESKNFYIENESLVIYLDSLMRKEEEIDLRIQYRSSPSYGLYQTDKGTFWTSNLPATTSHLLPVFDHPRIEFTSEFVITHPSGKTVVANGRIGETEIVSVDKELTTFVANRPVTPGGINFVMGQLERAGSTNDSGLRQQLTEEKANLFQRRSDNQIHLYSELSSTESAEIISIAADAFHRVGEFLDYPYPFRDLNLILLEDDFWETKPYGSGMLYLFQNRGDLERQIRMGVLSQWIGAYIREELWSDAEAINLLKAYAANELFELNYNSEGTPAPYNSLDDNQVSRWQHFLEKDENESLKRKVGESVRNIFNGNHNILSWNELASMIYNNSGQNYFDGLQPGEITTETESNYEYVAEMNWNEAEGTVQIDFESLGEPITELVTIRVSEITFQDEREHELTFTGQTDAIVLNVSSGIENLKLYVSSRDDIILNENKPFQFWIYQLQNEDDPQRRREAAMALSGFPDNPDLQLALTDLLNGETVPEVYAEILRSLASITMGASGTDQTFLDRTSDRQPKIVRLAAIEGLAYYRNNDMVISSLRSIINQTDDSDIRKTAVRSLYETTGPEAFRNITETLITREAALDEVPLMLSLLARHGEVEAAVQFSETFLTEGFPYRVRHEVLKLVIEYDNSRSGWENRLPDLLSDRDPRIRYQAVEALGKVSESVRTEMVQSRLAEELDERVRRALQDV
jgi:HEAT repeat protein